MKPGYLGRKAVGHSCALPQKFYFGRTACSVHDNDPDHSIFTVFLDLLNTDRLGCDRPFHFERLTARREDQIVW